MEGWFWLILSTVGISASFGERWGICAFFVLSFVGWCFNRIADEIEALREFLERDE
jgi:hypothetical protein